jgi:tricarballylate dehydrogenase
MPTSWSSARATPASAPPCPPPSAAPGPVGDAPFDPAVKDGKATRGIVPPKSNWAVPLAEPPFYGFKVTCGITFTFGGVRVDAGARVLDRSGRAIAGLHAAGELVGGLFFHNYPGGSGLTAGPVLGRRAGASAAAHAGGRREEAITA